MKSSVRTTYKSYQAFHSRSHWRFMPSRTFHWYTYGSWSKSNTCACHVNDIRKTPGFQNMYVHARHSIPLLLHSSRSSLRAGVLIAICNVCVNRITPRILMFSCDSMTFFSDYSRRDRLLWKIIPKSFVRMEKSFYPLFLTSSVSRNSICRTFIIL